MQDQIAELRRQLEEERQASDSIPQPQQETIVQR